MRARLAGIGVALAAVLLAGQAGAATLRVGPDETLKRPSAAARVARDGDTVLIAAGEYYDCAHWAANDLTIDGDPAGGTVMTDTACAGKASFITGGRGITVRNITFTRIRVPDSNGAGIRAEGGDLTIENCRFINNQVAILAAANPAATLRITASRFTDNGACTGQRCTSTLMAGRLAGLEIMGSVFEAPRAGLTIDAGAANILLRGNRIAGTGGGGLVRLDVAGPVMLDGNVLEQGGPSAPEPALRLDGGEGPVMLRGNTYTNTSAGPGTFVLNWSGADPRMQDNIVAQRDTALSTDGVWWERMRRAAHTVYDPARAFAGKVKGKLTDLAGRAAGKLHRLLPF